MKWGVFRIKRKDAKTRRPEQRLNSKESAALGASTLLLIAGFGTEARLLIFLFRGGIPCSGLCGFASLRLIRFRISQYLRRGVYFAPAFDRRPGRVQSSSQAAMVLFR